MREKIIQIFLPAETEDHRAVVAGGVKPVKMPVLTDMLVDQLAGPDVDWMVGLELDTVPRINVVSVTVVIIVWTVRSPV